MKVINFILAAIILLGCVFVLNACQSLTPPIEGYKWILTEWVHAGNAKTLATGAEISAFFNGETKILNGVGGCNLYNCTYKVDGLSLTINDDFMISKINCSTEKNDQENQYINTIKTATSYKMDHGNLIIYCGTDILKFQRENTDTKTIT
jgi:heat shock protein HslJ